jgi:RNA polymerase sigma factor (TIGR02999 family)
MDRFDEIASALNDLESRGQSALDRLLPIVYDELKAIAHRQRRRERADLTLNTTDLVHEAYVKLVGLDRMTWHNRAHVLAVAAQAMRRVLVDYAESRRAQKRGGGAQRVSLDEQMLQTEHPLDQLLAVDAQLQRLQALNPRLSRIVECRFFAGMSIEETAHALDTSPATVKRDWSLARAWLNRELSAESQT